MFSFHILSTFIIGSLFFFSSDIIYAANPQTLRNAYQIESNGQTKSYHLNDYGKKMVKKILGQYEKQIAQKGPDIIPLLITTTQNKLQGAQKTNSLGNMIIYTAVLYDLSQQNTSKGNDTTKETKITSTGSQVKKEVANKSYISVDSFIDQWLRLFRWNQGMFTDIHDLDGMDEIQRQILLQKIGGCSILQDNLREFLLLQELNDKFSSEERKNIENIILRQLGYTSNGLKDEHFKNYGVINQFFKNNCYSEKNFMFFKTNMDLLAKYIPGRDTLITYQAGDSNVVPSYVYNNIFSSDIGRKILPENYLKFISQESLPFNKNILHLQTDQFIGELSNQPIIKDSFQKDNLFSIHFCIKATTLLDHPGWIKERNDMFNKVNKNDSKNPNPWNGIDINASNKAFDEFVKNLCGNKSYYREIGSLVDEVTVTKTYKEHINQNFIIALKILNLTKDTFGKSWGSGWKYDIDALNVAIDKSIKTGVDPEDYKDYKRGMDIESDLAQFVQRVGSETINGAGPAKPDKKYFVHIPIEMLGEQAIEFDKKNNVYRFYGNETDEIIKGTIKQRNILWGKEGRDSIYGGDMDDIIVVVGDMSTGPSKEDTQQSFEFLGLSMFNFSGMNFNKNGSPRIIDGGAGKDVLFVVGDIDLSQTKMTGIEDIKIY